MSFAVFTEPRVTDSSSDWYAYFHSSSRVAAACDVQRRTVKPGECRKADSPRYEEELLRWLKTPVRTHEMDFHPPLIGFGSQCEEHWPRGPAAPEGVSERKRGLQGVCGGGSELCQRLRKRLGFELRPGAPEQCPRSLPASGSCCPKQTEYDLVTRERVFLLWSQLVFLVWAGSCRIVQMPGIAVKNLWGGSEF